MAAPGDGGPAIRAATPQDWDGICRLQMTAFHVTADPVVMAPERCAFEPDRTLLIDDGDQVVASAAAPTRQLTVPGGAVPAAHLTAVAVAATHRRRGLLTRLMRCHLRDCREVRGTPGALLPHLGAVHERLRPERPGWSSRDAGRWTVMLADPPAPAGRHRAERGPPRVGVRCGRIRVAADQERLDTDRPAAR